MQNAEDSGFLRFLFSKGKKIIFFEIKFGNLTVLSIFVPFNN